MFRKMVDTKTVRDRLGDLLDQARYRGDAFIIHRRGKPLAAIISYEEFQRYQEQRRKAFQVFDEVWEANADADPGKVAADVERAVEQVKRARRRAVRRGA